MNVKYFWKLNILNFIKFHSAYDLQVLLQAIFVYYNTI